MDDLKDHIEKIIPYRLRAVKILSMSLTYKMQWRDGPKPMKVYFDNRLAIEGNSNIFINAAIESGLIHSRALLDFAGIRINPNNPEKLKRRKKIQHPEDVVIESFSVDGTPLPRVRVVDLVTGYASVTEDVEYALATLISTTNKRLVHITSVGLDDHAKLQVLKTGSEIIPMIMKDYFYEPLRLPAPKF